MLNPHFVAYTTGPFVHQIDANAVSILEQDGQAIICFSRALTKGIMLCSVIKQDCLAVIVDMKQF